MLPLPVTCYRMDLFAKMIIRTFACGILCLVFADAYHSSGVLARRALLKKLVLAAPSCCVAVFPSPSLGDDGQIDRIQDGRDTLTTLLDNWERATVQCNYADVPRELLETKNKEELLEKASTFALFDKSASVESCKTTNRIVRDYLGATGKGPLVGMEKRLRQSLDFVDPERLDDFVAECENFSQFMARATSLSYTSGTADFDSMNNFEKGDKDRNSNSNLEQSRRAIVEVRDCLDRILGMLGTA